MLIFLPFILIFFLNDLVVLPLGLWRSKTGPRFAPVLLVVGAVLFINGQSSDVVNWPAYIGGVTAWFLALAGVVCWQVIECHKTSGHCSTAMAPWLSVADEVETIYITRLFDCALLNG